MYLKLWSNSKNVNELSFRIIKHPENAFSKPVTDSVVVNGFWTLEGEYPAYFAYTMANELELIKSLKKRNEACYVNSEFDSVCPKNLDAISMAFKSVMNGNIKATDSVDVFKPMQFYIDIGPFVGDLEKCIKFFQTAGFVSCGESTCTLNQEVKDAFGIRIECFDTLTKLLQKVYVVSYAWSSYINNAFIDQSKFEQLSKYSIGWIGTMENKEWLIKKLCNFNTTRIKKFVTELNIAFNESIDDPDKDVVLIKMDEVLRKYEGTSSERRKEIIIKLLKDSPYSIDSIMDIGCGNGKLLGEIEKEFRPKPKTWFTKLLNKFGVTEPKAVRKLIGVDLRSSKRNPSRSKIDTFYYESNAVYPNYPEVHHHPSVIIISEVLEHLCKSDRYKLYRLLSTYHRPKMMVITVPNIEFNEYLNKTYGINIEKYRHRDHKIEYTQKDVQDEIIGSMSDNYDFEFVAYNSEQEEIDGVPPVTYIVVGFRKESNQEMNLHLKRHVENMFAPFYIMPHNYAVYYNDLKRGSIMNRNSNDTMYLGPTIAPAEYNSKYPEYLEHPMTCFEYYKDRGVSKLVAEHKYMGSRCHICVCRDDAVANSLNLSNKVIAISRYGNPFFRDSEITNQIWETVNHNTFENHPTIEFVVLDTEVMPWAYKGQRLIQKDFVHAGTPTLLKAQVLKSVLPDADWVNDMLNNANRFMTTLNRYIGDDGAVEIRVFNVLAISTVTNKKDKKIFKFGDFMPKSEVYKWLSEICYGSTLMKPVEYEYVDLNDEQSVEMCIRNWDEYCTNNGGEGYVFKPSEPISNEAGLAVLPYMKVRGKEYLTIIYGMNYLRPDIFNVLTSRPSIPSKRYLSALEFELGWYMLKNFCERDKMFLHDKFVNTFIGLDCVKSDSIDATL